MLLFQRHAEWCDSQWRKLQQQLLHSSVAGGAACSGIVETITGFCVFSLD